MIISSGDKDFYQLLGPQVSILSKYTRGQGERPVPTWVTEESMKSDTGLDPSQWVDYTIAIGGKNDVPGLDGIGPKSATELLVVHRTLPEAFEGQPRGVELNTRQTASLPSMTSEWYSTMTKLTTLRDDLDIGWEQSPSHQMETFEA